MEAEITENCAPWRQEIARIVVEAFAARFGTGEDEAKLIERLRADRAVVAELTALEGGAVVGHAMLSNVDVQPAKCQIAALGPVCARRDRQNRGIGRALIEKGHEICRVRGFGAVIVLGDPEYYGRFGYSLGLAKNLDCRFSGPHFQALELQPGALGQEHLKVSYAAAFGNGAH